MKKRLNIVKIGGNVIDDTSVLNRFLSDFSKIKGEKLLVHGGGKLATQLAEQMGLPQKMLEGRRVTDKNTLDIVVMVYAGLINKNIVARLQAQQTEAIGVSGADLNLIESLTRPKKPVDYGYVGDVKKVNRQNIAKLLKMGFVPVFCAITHEKGQLLNTNADTIAAEIAIAMSAEYDCSLYYCFEKKGVLAVVEDENSVIPEITKADYQQLKEKNKIFSGMIPKLDNTFYTLERGVKEVYILRAEDLLKQINTPASYGTRIIAE